MRSQQLVKLILVVLLFLCLAPMPYGYFQLVRFTGLIGFGYLAYTAHGQNKQTEMFIFAALALLFQPFFKIALGREIWNLIDIIIGTGLLVVVIKSSHKK